MWQPIETAPKDFRTKVDVWAVDRKTGRSYRVADCNRCPGKNYPDTWLDSRGSWVGGRRYINDEGDWCFDPNGKDETSTVVTHWMPLPNPPAHTDHSAPDVIPDRIAGSQDGIGDVGG